MSPDSFKDYYATLGLQLGATNNAIKSAFHALTIDHEPDAFDFSNTTLLRDAREAYEKLTDTDYRRAYDRNYWRMKLQTDPPEARPGGRLFGLTRTEQYEAEMEAKASRASPPPKKPSKTPSEPGWKYLTSPAYREWQRLSDEYYARHIECSPP